MRLLTCWMLLLVVPGLAQDNAPAQKQARPPFTLKTTPLNLINPFQQSIDLLADIPFSPRWGVELGVGVVIDSWTSAVYADESYRGIKIKPAVKYYFKRPDWGDHYLALALKYNDLKNDRYVNAVRQGGQYSEWMLQRCRMVTWGAALRVGSQIYLGKRKRWVFEPFLGLGVRQLRITHRGLPPDAELLDEQQLFSVDRQPGTYTTPDVMTGFALGWVFPKRLRKF